MKIAMFPGRCHRCPTRIQPEDIIVRTDDGHWAHEKCPPDPTKVYGTTCPRCGLVHPGEC